MTHLRRDIWGTGLARWRRKSPAALALAVLLIVAQVQTSIAAITNQATAIGSYNAAVVTSNPSSQSVPLAPANGSMAITKTGTLNDDDGTPGLSAGDTISWTVSVENTGNVTLTGIGVADPTVALTYQSGDANTNSAIDVGETWNYSGSQTIIQNDLDTNGGGDGDIDNTVTVSSDQLPDQNASGAVAISATPHMTVTKVVDTVSELFPGILDINYKITVINDGTVTLTNIRLSDDLATAFAPGTIISGPALTLAGFAGTGSTNPGYDGAGDLEMLAGDVRLAPGQSGEVFVHAFVDTGIGSISFSNTANGSSAEITGPVPSDDPLQTPTDPLDQNPTLFNWTDSDGDGASDLNENTSGSGSGTGSPGGPSSSDRDGDGIPDASDYDPTGLFYCEADGRILSGGLITVENLTAGGSQTGVGSNADITIVKDGSDGNYQFHVTAPGDYRLSYTLPAGGVASTTRLALPPLDATSLLPANPAVLGSGEFGSTGFLADFTAGANPFHLDFTFEAGDPVIFNNNIPLQFCGSPQLSASKQVANGPVLQPDGRSLITYRLTATSSGNEQVNEVQISDDLNAIFGAGNFQIVSSTITAAPAGFGAVVNPFFDGDTNTTLLTSGGDLLPGESVELELQLLVDVPSGSYSNSITASGVSPLDASPVPSVSSAIPVLVIKPVGSGELFARKTANVTSARLGDVITYTIAISNNLSTGYSGVEIVDRMPAGFSYVAGSARIDTLPVEPVRNGNELVWSGQSLPAATTVSVTFNLVVGAAASGSQFINYGFVRDPSGGSMISNLARAVVERETEPVFDCSEVIGKVFDDKNRDGYLQEGEAGLPGVRIATVKGLLVTTDKAGRFHVTCAMIPDENIGSNFEMKLDPRTLPDGYSVTTENPRVIRLTRGKLSKLNFGAARARLVRLELSDESFEGNSLNLKRDALISMANLIKVLEGEMSILRISYPGSGSSADKRERMKAVESLLDDAWKAKRRPYELKFELHRTD
ncbi:MAG: DUF11 domain-containing protein [Nitratireductor sp.]|nr:DUF11 domain-containing protein [Nitratireductor sp.]